jgi:hypothetical protein
MSKRYEWGKLIIFVVILAIPLTLLTTTPTIFFMKGYLPGGIVGEDAVEHLYVMWWYYESLVGAGQNPANLTLLAYPTGFYNPYITAAPLVRVMALPFMGWLDPTLIYNWQLLLTFPLTWVAMSVLCYYLTRDFEASVLGGFVYTFSPHRLLHASAGRDTMVMTFWFPLLALSLISFLRVPTWRKAVLCGLLLSISLAIELHVSFYFTVPFVLIILVYQVWKRSYLLRDRAFLSKFGVVVLIPLLIQGPLLGAFAIDKFSGKLDFLQAGGVELYSADLLGILVPPPQHPLVKLLGLNEFAIRLIGIDGWTENIVYIGLLIIPLLFIALRNRDFPDRDLWLGMSLIGAVLLLGPRLRLAGLSTPIILPHVVLSYIPFLEWGRTPARFAGLMMFGLAILVAYGAAVLFRRLRQARYRPYLLVGLLILIWIDYAVFLLPWHLAQVAPPPVYREIQESPETLAVLDIPAAEYDVSQRSMGYQMMHEHPIVVGRAYRVPPEIAQQRQAFEDLAAEEHAAELLAAKNIGYVVLHLAWLEDTAPFWRSHLGRELGDPIFENTELVVYRVPQAE